MSGFRCWKQLAEQQRMLDAMREELQRLKGTTTEQAISSEPMIAEQEAVGPSAAVVKQEEDAGLGIDL